MFRKYKHNLIKFEKEIYNRGKEYLIKNQSHNKIIKKYCTKNEFKTIFEEFSHNLKINISKKYKNRYKLFPFGSITEFLSTDKSDIDIYLCVDDSLSKQEKIEMLNEILKKCPNFSTDVQKIVSSRICLIHLKFKGCEIDLSVTGFAPYIHSLLFREYSLIDPRFPLLALTLKEFAKINNLNKENYLNSYSWMNLLVAFLQDIIQPPVLPKLYSENEINEFFYKNVKFGIKNKHADKTFSQFFEKEKIEIIPIPDCLFDKKKIKKIYLKFLDNNYKNYGVEKNNLSCAEIFLKFLEFITFYCKFDTIYVRSSIDKEGYFSMEEIKNVEINDNERELYEYKNGFYNYFIKKYNKYIDFKEKKRYRDGLILIRDPIDGHYNPGQSFKLQTNFEDFTNILRFSYSCLIKYGSFSKLSEKIKEKNNQRSANGK